MKIEKCLCGKHPNVTIYEVTGFYRVECDHEGILCWLGPSEKTESRAIALWNKGMRRMVED